MKIIKQKDDNGCGMACVAMIAGISYEDACEEGFLKKRGSYTDTSHLRVALERLGYRVAQRLQRFENGQILITKEDLQNKRFKELESLSCDAICKSRPITRRKDKNTWHWVVWDHRRKRILDPRTPPYKELRLSSFLPVADGELPQ